MTTHSTYYITSSILSARHLTTRCACGHTQHFYLEDSRYEQWRSGGLIQSVFPKMHDEDREMLITGICPDCWTKMFPEESTSLQA